MPDEPLYFSAPVPTDVPNAFVELRKACLDWPSTTVRPDFRNENYEYYLEICTAARKPSLIKGIINLDRSMAPKTQQAPKTEAHQSATGPLGYHPVVEYYAYAVIGLLLLFALYRAAKAGIRRWEQAKAYKQVMSGIDAVDLSQTAWPSTHHHEVSR